MGVILNAETDLVAVILNAVKDFVARASRHGASFNPSRRSKPSGTLRTPSSLAV
jgi:hypothetical protein